MPRPAWRACALFVCLYGALCVHADELSEEFSSAISYDALSDNSKELVLGVYKDITFDLQIGPRQMQGSKDVFEYLMDHLELCAIAGRSLGIGNYETRREDDGRLFGNDNHGATGYLTFLHATDGRRVFHVEGKQEGFFTVGGNSIVVLDYKPADGQKEVIEYELHVWVQVDNAFFAFLSRLFLGMSKSTADRQFTSMLSIPVGVTQKVAEEPRGVLQAFERLSEDEQSQLRELRELIVKQIDG